MRNFQDPETPINDEIIEEDTWKKNYRPDDYEKVQNINRGDVNAVKLGHWITFKVLSNVNLSMRDIDQSYFVEQGFTGVPRSFFPLHKNFEDGAFKIPESNILNGGISSQNAERRYYELPDVPWIKNQFDNRIIYSERHVNDAFRNGYRVFLSTHYRDYTKEYGSIVKLINYNDDIICVFEHGVARFPVNERALIGEGPGGPMHLNVNSVLPEANI